MCETTIPGVFPKFSVGGTACPLCNTDADKPCILVPIDGTQDGSCCEAMPVHVECMAAHLHYHKSRDHVDFMYARCPKRV
ncbi:MAG TPA: hypothetical protein VMW48_02375 [Vicinamibacterales bacterium]|nr:hypothetical protein [Vicinamibacterales bacterium]